MIRCVYSYVLPETPMDLSFAIKTTTYYHRGKPHFLIEGKVRFLLTASHIVLNLTYIEYVYI